MAHTAILLSKLYTKSNLKPKRLSPTVENPCRLPYASVVKKALSSVVLEGYLSQLVLGIEGHSQDVASVDGNSGNIHPLAVQHIGVGVCAAHGNACKEMGY